MNENKKYIGPRRTERITTGRRKCILSKKGNNKQCQRKRSTVSVKEKILVWQKHMAREDGKVSWTQIKDGLECYIRLFGL